MISEKMDLFFETHKGDHRFKLLLEKVGQQLNAEPPFDQNGFVIAIAYGHIRLMKECGYDVSPVIDEPDDLLLDDWEETPL